MNVSIDNTTQDRDMPDRRRFGALFPPLPRSAATARLAPPSLQEEGNMAAEDIAIESRVEPVRNHPFLQGLAPAYLDELAGITKTIRFGTNDIILQEGEESTHLYLIIAGRVALEISEVNRPFRVDVLGAGDEFGWSWALGTPGVYQVRALEPVEALVIQASKLMSLCDQDNAFGYVLMRRLLGVVAKRLQSTRVTVIDMYLPAAKRAGA